MKKTLLALGFATSLAATSQAASFIEGFAMPPYVLGDFATQAPTWSINDSATDLSFISASGSPSDGVVGLGGIAAAPGITAVELSHPLALTIDKAIVSLDFTLTESTAAFPNRDSFGWTLRDSSNNTVFRLALVPGASPGGRNIFYYLGTNPTPVNSGFALPTGVGAMLDLTFTTSGMDATFTGTLNNLPISGTVPGAGAGSFGSIAADFDVAGATGADAGDNYMSFDNISLTTVPEPSSTMLAGLALLGAVGRRRRR